MRIKIMNTKQRIILAVSAAVILLMVLFPPYVVMNYKRMVIEAGYGFLFSLPPHRYEFLGEQHSIPAIVNTSQLVVQIVGVLIAGLLMFFAHKDESPELKSERGK
jgi:hypothetical protein